MKLEPHVLKASRTPGNAEASRIPRIRVDRGAVKVLFAKSGTAHLAWTRPLPHSSCTMSFLATLCVSPRRRDRLSVLTPFSFAVVSVVQCYSITTPSGWSNGQTAIVAWTGDSSDPPTFSVELVNPTLLNNHPFAIATTLNKNDGSYTFNLPSVPAG